MKSSSKVPKLPFSADPLLPAHRPAKFYSLSKEQLAKELELQLGKPCLTCKGPFDGFKWDLYCSYKCERSGQLGTGNDDS